MDRLQCCGALMHCYANSIIGGGVDTNEVDWSAYFFTGINNKINNKNEK